MYSWSSLLNESQKQITTNNPNGGVVYLSAKKTEYIQRLSEKTGRNTILYFSAFMHKPTNLNVEITDKDINAFMENVHGLDKGKGLDLILHSPGGNLAATEQIIYYLNSYFGNDIRAIVPQMAMSAASLISVSCKSILMGRQSCIGPFDPILNGVQCQAVLREFKKAIDDVEKHPASLGLWQTIISKLNPTFITLCEQADKLSEELTEKILSNKGLGDEAKNIIKRVFGTNEHSKTHSRHIDRSMCREAGLVIDDLETDQSIQDLVLGIHHCCMILGEQSNIVKIVENNVGGRYQLHENN